MKTAAVIPCLWPERLTLVTDSAEDTVDPIAEDDRLLQEVDSDPQRGYLHLWELDHYQVIAGRSNTIEREIDVAACEKDAVRVRQRVSGGGAVVLGPGCLCYALVLPISERHRQLGVDRITADLMQRLAEALSRPHDPVTVHGVSDLVLGGRKFSGNSQRWRRQALLHHGTILFDFDLSRVSRYLKFPSRVPDYRDGRDHEAFICNFDLPRSEIVNRLCAVWGIEDSSR